jgi:serine protease Do
MWLTLAADGPASTAAQTGQAVATATGVELSRSIEATASLVHPSVVQIFAISYGPSQGLLPRGGDLVTTERASGSGVIVDRDGYIVTNAHVVRNARHVRVELPAPNAGASILSARSRAVGGQIVALDLETDLAVIKVEERNLPALAFGDSDELKPGQLVLAVGSPLGLRNSVSLGVISAVARQLEPESPMIYVQTDASINPGSSGGPLVDMRGRLIGINTMIASQAGGNEGLGFAAPGNIVRSVFEQIKATGHVRRGDIGVRAQTITPVLAAALGLARDQGVVLSDVRPGGSGMLAGLRSGDIVLSVNGKPMENGRQFQVTLYRGRVGEVVTLEVLREGRAQKFPVAMDERRDPLASLSGTIDARENLVARLGMLGVDVDQQVAAMLPGLRTPSGVLVLSTVAGAIDSREGGLAPGDIVHGLNRTEITRITQLRSLLTDLKSGDPVVLTVERRGELIYLPFTVE